MTVISDVYPLDHGSLLLLYLKLARVDVVKKGKNMEGIITWGIFTSWFLTELCLYILFYTNSGFVIPFEI